MDTSRGLASVAQRQRVASYCSAKAVPILSQCRASHLAACLQGHLAACLQGHLVACLQGPL